MHIEKGHKHNAKVVLRGEAGYSEPGIQPGDVIFVLEQKPHKTFKRIQADLVIEKVCRMNPTQIANVLVTALLPFLPANFAPLLTFCQIKPLSVCLLRITPCFCLGPHV